MTTKSTQFLSHQNAAEWNRNAILNFIKCNAPVSRTDIWNKMGLSRAAVTQIIKQLIDQGLVREIGMGESNGGRKPCLLEVIGNSRQILVFEWHMKTLFLTDMDSHIEFRTSIPLDHKSTVENFVQVLSRAIEEVIDTQKVDPERILGLGLVMPGLIEPNSGTVMLSTEQEWENVRLAHLMEKSTGIRTILESDGNMQALGEYIYGVGSRVRDFVLLTIEDEGIGSALILNGSLQRGCNFMSGEVGHITLSDDGPLCACGKKGCIEAFFKDVMKKGDRTWQDEAARYIGKAASIIINILDPEVVILAGKVIERGGEGLVDRIRKSAYRDVLNAESRSSMIDRTSVEDNLSIKGICGCIYDISFSRYKS